MDHSLSKLELWLIWKKSCNQPIWAQNCTNSVLCHSAAQCCHWSTTELTPPPCLGHRNPRLPHSSPASSSLAQGWGSCAVFTRPPPLTPPFPAGRSSLPSPSSMRAHLVQATSADQSYAATHPVTVEPGLLPSTFFINHRLESSVAPYSLVAAPLLRAGEPAVSSPYAGCHRDAAPDLPPPELVWPGAARPCRWEQTRRCVR
jgi:hypothetical protein